MDIFSTVKVWMVIFSFRGDEQTNTDLKEAEGRETLRERERIKSLSERISQCVCRRSAAVRMGGEYTHTHTHRA